MLILHGGHRPVSAFLIAWGVECGGIEGRPKAATSRSVVFNDVLGKVCVCVKGGGGLALGMSLLKSYTSGWIIWKGCNKRKTPMQTEKEDRRKGVVLILLF